MKKMLSFLLAVLMLLGAMPAMAEDAIRNPMPDEIAALFDVPAWDGFDVMVSDSGWAAWEYNDSMDAGVAVMSNGSLHIVCLIEPDSKGNLRITQRNYKMVVGNDVPSVYWSYGNTTHELRTPWEETRMFEIVGNGYYIAFGKFSGVWRVKTIINYKTETLSYVFNEKIGYLEPEAYIEHLDYDVSKMKYAYGTYDNRFAAFNIYDFPKSLEEARSKLTNPPVTPTDFYTPVTVTLRANEKYDVFAAPGRGSHRASNGKAEMSTNDWVQIFGEEDGWLLVQYDISSERMRFGYISASALPRNTQVQQLTWYDLPEQTIQYGVYMTDDPLASQSMMCWMEPGKRVRVLSSFDTWYYVETTDKYGKTVRGFVPQSCIEVSSALDMVG